MYNIFLYCVLHQVLHIFINQVLPIFISRMERIHFAQDSKAGGDQDGEIISSTLGEQGVTVHARKGFDRGGGGEIGEIVNLFQIQDGGFSQQIFYSRC